MDLYSSSVADIQNGNMRSRSQLALSQGIASHNSDLALQIKDLKLRGDQITQQGKNALKSQSIEQGIQGVIGGFMEARGVKSGLQTYKDYVAKGQSKASALSNLKSTAGGVEGDVRVGDTQTAPSVEQRPQTTTEPNATATPEGEPAQNHNSTGGDVDINPSAEEHNVITAGEDGAGKSGSMIHNGMKNITGLTDESIERVGRGAGALASAGSVGIDIYQDIKKKSFGDNGWEAAGQVSQIGGAIADTIGVAFPPAELLGAGLGLVGGVLDDIGEAFESSKTKKENQEKAQTQQEAQQQAKEAQVQAVQSETTAPVAATAASARVAS